MSLAKILAEYFKSNDIYRDHYRSKDLLFKWCDDHWDSCQPILEKFCFTDEDYHLLMRNSPNASSVLGTYLESQTDFNPIDTSSDNRYDDPNPDEQLFVYDNPNHDDQLFVYDYYNNI